MYRIMDAGHPRLKGKSDALSRVLMRAAGAAMRVYPARPL
jgi:hypothetical protein